MKLHFLAVAGIALPLLAMPARGEMDHREYLPVEVEKPAEARLQLQRQIETDLADAAVRAAKEREAAEAARLAMEAELAARPLGVRLAEIRCATVCHGPERFALSRHTRLGWQAVILRMQYMNGAIIKSGESNALARHLAETQPASPLASVLEYAMLPALLAILWMGRQGWQRWKTEIR
ncbi:MAG: hypothetical protein Q8M20_15235 [Rhodocyclaceae bacterium]|nr:hypothetical protein [Rhodocyclaceae bacterium]MDZ4215142.1 hypothetical protein [Rhodocyclaceae bacterium]